MIDPSGLDAGDSKKRPQTPFESALHEAEVQRSSQAVNDAELPNHGNPVREQDARIAHSDRQKEKSSGFQRAIGAARSVLPAILPLLEGNVATAATNLLASRGKQLDLSPVERALERLQAEQRSLRGDFSDYKVALRSLEDELRIVKAAAEKSAQEQQSLETELRAARRRFAMFAWLGLLLFAIAISIDVFLLVRLYRA